MGTRDGEIRSGCLRGPFARLVLMARAGARPILAIGRRRYRLSEERVLRLEELDGGFVYFLRDAVALRRRVARLADGLAAEETRVDGPWVGPEAGN